METRSTSEGRQAARRRYRTKMTPEKNSRLETIESQFALEIPRINSAQWLPLQLIGAGERLR